MWINCKPQGSSVQSARQICHLFPRCEVCLYFFIMQFLCPFGLTGNQKKITRSNKISGRSLTKKKLEKMNAFTRLILLLHLLPPNYAHTLICLKDQKQEQKDNFSSCQTQGKEMGGKNGKKISRAKSQHFCLRQSQAGFVSFFPFLVLK